MNRFKEKTAGLISISDLKTFKGKIIYWLCFAILCLFAFGAIIPAIWTVLTSLKETQEIYSGFSFMPKDMSITTVLERVKTAWSEMNIVKPTINTLIVSVGNVIITIIVCGFGGYVLSKIKPKGTKLIFTLVVWTLMMPSQTRIVTNYISYLHFPFALDWGGINILDTFWPIWFSAAASAFNVILFKNTFDGLSNSYVEAGKLDGANQLQIFFKIMLPMAKAVIMYVSIIVLNSAWSDFFTPMLVLQDRMTLPVVLYRMKMNKAIHMNTYFMALIFASIPPLLIFAFFSKRILGGINIGGVKG